MHGQLNQFEFVEDIRGFLGCFYLVASVVNVGAAYYWWGQRRESQSVHGTRRSIAKAAVWLGVAVTFAIMAVIAWSGEPQQLQQMSFPESMRNGIDRLLGPTVFTLGSIMLLACFYVGRRFFTLPAVAWGGLNLALLSMGLAMTDPDFAAIVSKPDNVPIVGLIFLLGFFTWLSARKAVLNDERFARGMPPLEAEDNDKVLVWPDLVYIELICMVALTALLLFWSIVLKAPLEEQASTVNTPNPSKAPWYFLGLQEMLVYFDPWMAGVVLPLLIICGLCAIPYLDVNTKGNGYYTIKERRFAYVTFQMGFLVLWIAVMLIGTFFRGPNWSFFGFFETWDPHKVEALNNVKLSERFWIDWFDRPLPATPPTAGGWASLGYILLREMPGLVMLAVYFVCLPLLLVKYSRQFRSMYLRMGLARYVIFIFLFLMMGLLPIKMVCRWSFNLNYFVSIPEYFFNF